MMLSKNSQAWLQTTATTDTIRTQYNQLAAIYDRRWQHYIHNTLSFLKNWESIPSQAKVLDLACGTGELERLLLEENPTLEIVGVDISEQMLAIATQKCLSYPHVSFTNSDVTNLPFADDSFDVIVSASAFHYFDQPLVALAEMRRVLHPQGKVIMLDWCRDYFTCKLLHLALQAIDPAHRRCYTQAEFHTLLATAGFQLERSTKTRLDWFWGIMVITAKPQNIEVL